MYIYSTNTYGMSVIASIVLETGLIVVIKDPSRSFCASREAYNQQANKYRI